MTEILQTLLNISLVIFMVGNLLDMGLRLKLEQALAGLRNARFVVMSLVWGFVLCPTLAYLLSEIMPLDRSYALGLVLLGLAPCAPFLPAMADKARGDLGSTAAFMLLASVVTVIYMPFAVPLLTKGLTATASTIAKPLLFFILVPLLMGMTIQRLSASTSAKLQPYVKKVTGLDTVLMLVLCLVVYGKGFVGAIGTYAIGAEILFFAVATAASYAFSFGLPQNQRSVVALGMSTRNIGAALAPLFGHS